MKKQGAAREALAQQRRAPARPGGSAAAACGGGPIASASSRKYSATRPELRPSAPAPTHTTSPDGAQLVQPRRRVGAGAARQHVALPDLGGQREPLQRDEHLAQPVDAGARRAGGGRRPATTGRNAASARWSAGLDLLAQDGQRRAAQPAQHLGVAPLALAAAGAQLAAHAASPARLERASARRRVDAVARAQLGGGERAVGARVAGDELAQRVGRRRPRNASGSPPGGTAPSASRYRPASSAAIQRSSPPTRMRDRAALVGQRVEHARRRRRRRGRGRATSSAVRSPSAAQHVGERVARVGARARPSGAGGRPRPARARRGR